jgi:tRNA-modifying protein YgfZ
MSRAETLEERIEALEAGRAFVDRSGFRLVALEGSDAVPWLDALVTGPVARLGPGGACRSLFLDPTGHLRADVQVMRLPNTRADWLLVCQDPRQPNAIDDLLAPYVLSSGVRLGRPSIGLWCVPNALVPRDAVFVPSGRPSMLGGGFDVAMLEGPPTEELTAELESRFVQVDEDTIEAWRIRRGVARFPADLGEDALPAEAGLVELAVDLDKGCFLGQESVARVRNLGHPPKVLLALRAPGRVGSNDPVIAHDSQVGTVTSATRVPDGTALLARVLWGARDEPLVTASGVPLRPAPIG